MYAMLPDPIPEIGSGHETNLKQRSIDKRKSNNYSLEFSTWKNFRVFNFRRLGLSTKNFNDENFPINGIIIHKKLLILILDYNAIYIQD